MSTINYTDTIFYENRLNQELVNLFKEKDYLFTFKNSKSPYIISIICVV